MNPRSQPKISSNSALNPKIGSEKGAGLGQRVKRASRSRASPCGAGAHRGGGGGSSSYTCYPRGRDVDRRRRRAAVYIYIYIYGGEIELGQAARRSRRPTRYSGSQDFFLGEEEEEE